MKFLVSVMRVFVGFLFIISGLIKLNDPLGFSFKLDEYFSPAVFNLEFLSAISLQLALFVVILEVLLGVALLLGIWRRLVVFNLLGLITFFTFLTFYSAFYNKVTDCGCFGDAIKLTPWESFTKDVILLVAILILYWGYKHINYLVSHRWAVRLMSLCFIGSVFLGYWVLNHLPLVDFRPYKIGVSISEQIEIPEDAPAEEYRYIWTFERDGTLFEEITSGSFPTISDANFTGSVKTELVQAAFEPPIHDFTMILDGEDYTSSLLNEEKAILITSYDFESASLNDFDKVVDFAEKKFANGYAIYGMTAASDVSVAKFYEEYGSVIRWYQCDQTTVKTIVRSNPGVLWLNQGVITDKKHINDIY